MKRVMILGANELLLPLIKKASEMGLYTIVVSPDPAEPGFNYATDRRYINIVDKEAVLAAARELKIDGIVTDQAETPIQTVAYVAEKMHLPGIGIEKAQLFRDKYLMRKKCDEIGVNNVRYFKVSTLLDAKKCFKELGGKAILKPVDSAGSRGVVELNSESDLGKYFLSSLQSSRKSEVIIEEFIEGKELLADGVVFNGEYQNIILGQYTKSHEAFSSNFTFYPANISKIEKERVIAFVKKVVEGFGLPWGRTHTEIKINENGIWLIETAARGGGKFISSGFVPLLTDFSSEEFLLKACLDEVTSMPKIRHKGISAAYCCFFLPEGEVIGIDGINEVLSLPFTHSNNYSELNIGLHTSKPKDKTSAFFIHLDAPNYDELVARRNVIRDLVKVKVKTEDGIKGPIWE